MYKCFCGEECHNKKSLAQHLSRNHEINESEKERILLDIVYGKEVINNAIARYLKKEVGVYCLEKEGLQIRKYFKLLGINRSSKEERTTDRYKEKIKNSVFEKYGVDNISKLEEFKKKKKETVMKNYGVTHNFLIKETKEKALENYQKITSTQEYKQKWSKKYKQTCQEKYGVDNVAKAKEIRKKNSQKQKENCAKLTLEEKRKMTEKARAFWQQHNNWVSSIELRIRNILSKMNIKFQSNKTLFNYNYDLVINNVIIEVNGDFWHGNPKLYQAGEKLFETLMVDEVWEKDKLKKEVAEQNGKKVYILWESDIIKATDEELEKILKEWI